MSDKAQGMLTFPSVAAMNAAVYSPYDATKFVRVTSPLSYYIITQVVAGVGTFVQIDTGGGVITYGNVVALTVGGGNVNGVATTVSRSDHVHGLPAFGSSAGTFCQGNDSRLSDARVPTGPAGGDLGGTYPNPTVVAFESASTSVNVAAATAPTAGQALIATDSTHAVWGIGTTPLLYETATETHWGGLYSVYRRLTRSYTGPLFRVRRASDNATAYIYCAAGKDTADTAALTAFCTGTDGFVTVVYNQAPWGMINTSNSPGGRLDLTQGTSANQPKIYASATGPITNAGGKLAMSFNGTSQVLSRGSALGFNSTQPFTLVIAVDNNTTTNGIVAQLGSGNGSARAYLDLRRGASATAAIVSDQQDANFTLSGSWANSNWYQIQKASAQDISHTHFWEAGTDKGVNGAANTAITFSDQGIVWGAGFVSALSGFAAMKSNTLIIADVVPDSTDNTAIAAEMALHI